MAISFVWLYVFKCDLCMLNYLMIKPKKIFECFMCFWKWFLSLWSLKFFSNVKFLVLKNFVFGHFTTTSRVASSCKILKKFQIFKNFRQRISWVLRDLDLTRENMPCASAYFVSRLVTVSQVTDSRNAEKHSF